MSDFSKKIGARGLLSLIILGLGMTLPHAQKRSSVKKKAGFDASIPKAEIPKLKQRLELFLHYQLTEQWDKLPELLGGKLNGNAERIPFTTQEKTALVDGLKKNPISNFTWQTTSFSTWILSVPQKKKWWFLEGTTIYGTGAESREVTNKIEAYKINAEWYFSPLWATGYGWTTKVPE